MKKTLTLFASLVTIVCSAQNIVNNSSFEENMNSWTKNIDEASGADALFNVVADAHSGFNGLQANVKSVGSNPWDIMLIQDLQTIEDNYYELSMFAKSAKPGKKIRLQFQKTTYTSKDIELTTDWKEYKFAVVAKEDNLQFVIQFFEEGFFHVDDIKIIQKPKPLMSLIDNGSFEEGDKGWININNNGAIAKFSITDDNPADGKKSLLCLVLANGKNPWDVQSIADFPTERYKKYRLTFYAKSNTAGTKLKAQIQKTTYTPKDFVLTAEWKKYEFVFAAKENDMQAAFHYLDTGLYYIDGVSIEKLSKSKSKKKKKKKKNK